MTTKTKRRTKTSYIMRGRIRKDWLKTGFREQPSHPTFGKIRTIRLYDTDKGFIVPTVKVEIIIKELPNDK